MHELLTMEAPFQECLDHVEIKDVLEAITGKASLTSRLPEHLLGGTSKQFRPAIPEQTDTAFGDVSV